MMSLPLAICGGLGSRKVCVKKRMTDETQIGKKSRRFELCIVELKCFLVSRDRFVKCCMLL